MPVKCLVQHLSRATRPITRTTTVVECRVTASRIHTAEFGWFDKASGSSVGHRADEAVLLFYNSPTDPLITTSAWRALLDMAERNRAMVSRVFPTLTVDTTR